MSDIGIIRVFFLLGLLSFLAFILFMMSSEIPKAYYVSGIYSLIIILVQVKRQDKIFLKSHFNNYKLITFVEYLILSIPIFICLIYHLQWMTIIAYVIGIATIINIDLKPRYQNLNTKFQQLIPHDSFEFKAGVRKAQFLIIPLWIIGFSTSFYIGSVPIVLFILGIIPLGLYEKGEPYQMIIAFEMNAKKFLLHKIWLQTKLFSITAIPLIIGFIIFNSEIWYIPVAEYFLFISLHIYIVLTKYAFYEPNTKAPASAIYSVIGTLGLLLPFFSPLIWLLSIRFYFKSVENLNYYLNDFN